MGGISRLPLQKDITFLGSCEKKGVRHGCIRQQVPHRRVILAGVTSRIAGPVMASLSMSDVTRILTAIDGGDPRAAEQLLPLVYDELRKLAAKKMGEEKPGQTLDATALVHEAWLRLVGSENEQKWDSRGHFFAAAAEAMRRILVEIARRKRSVKHGGGRRRVKLEDAPAQRDSDELLALDESLTRLAAEDALAAQVVELRQFAGLGHEEVAAALKITVYEARQKWTYARAWLQNDLARE
jgi:RNA polymerase sigma factor (TIGR02999 family)